MSDNARTDAYEQDVYARWLAWFVRLGFGLLVASFFLYVTGLVPAGIAPARLPQLWGLPIDQYLAATHAPKGWSWVARLTEGDLLNLVGVAVLNCATLACYLRVMPLFARSGQRGYVVVCVLQALVLASAAVGIFTR